MLDLRSIMAESRIKDDYFGLLFHHMHTAMERFFVIQNVGYKDIFLSAATIAYDNDSKMEFPSSVRFRVGNDIVIDRRWMRPEFEVVFTYSQDRYIIQICHGNRYLSIGYLYAYSKHSDIPASISINYNQWDIGNIFDFISWNVHNNVRTVPTASLGEDKDREIVLE